MKKIVFRIFLILIVIISFGALGFLLWLQGNGFRNWISNRLDLELEKYNLCLIGELKVDPLHFQAELDNLKIQTCDSKETILTAKHLYLKVRVVSFFSKKFQLQDFLIDRPQFFVKFDAQGSSNLSQIKAPTQSGQETSFISTLNAIVRDGELFYNDERIGFSGELKNFTLSTAINKAKGHQVNLIASNSSLNYQGRNITLDQLVLSTRLFSDHAEVQSLNLQSSIATVSLTGKLENWQLLKYDFNILGELDLNKAARLIPLNQAVSGTVSLTGRVEGERLNYKFQGQIESPQINVANSRIYKLNLNGEFAKETFSGKANIAEINYQNVLVRSFQTLSLKANKQTISLAKFTATTLGGTISGDATVSLENQPSQASVTLSNIDIATLSNLLAKKSLPIAGTLNSEVKANWPGINFNLFSGEIAANFTGSVGILPTPSLQEDKDAGKMPALPEAIPLNGEILAKITKNNVLLDKAIFTSKTTNINTTGTVFLADQNFDLLTKVETANILEIRQLAEKFGVTLPIELGTVANSNKEQLSLQGKLSFDGKLTGVINNPSVQGDVFIEEIFSGQESLGQFSGNDSIFVVSGSGGNPASLSSVFILYLNKIYKKNR